MLKGGIWFNTILLTFSTGTRTLINRQGIFLFSWRLRYWQIWVAGNWFNGSLAHKVGNFRLIFSRKSSDVCHAEVAISNVITLLTPHHGNSKRHLLSFTIQPKQKTCSATVAANMWGPFFYLGRLLGMQNSACMLILFCFSALRGEQEEYTRHRHKVVRVINTTTFGGWKHHCNKLF